jgi:hypothetical protein
MDIAKVGVTFTASQLARLNVTRDWIATTPSIAADDFDCAPFSRQRGIGKARQLFGEALPMLLEEFNDSLAA